MWHWEWKDYWKASGDSNIFSTIPYYYDEPITLYKSYFHSSKAVAFNINLSIIQLINKWTDEIAVLETVLSAMWVDIYNQSWSKNHAKC